VLNAVAQHDGLGGDREETNEKRSEVRGNPEHWF